MTNHFEIFDNTEWIFLLKFKFCYALRCRQRSAAPVGSLRESLVMNTGNNTSDGGYLTYCTHQQVPDTADSETNLWKLCSVTMFHTHLHLHASLTRKTNGRSLESLQKATFWKQHFHLTFWRRTFFFKF